MANKEKSISFEEALDELEKIAESLERGQLSLEDSIKAYERGMELKAICSQRLKEAEGKIEALAKSPDDKIIKASLTKDTAVKEKKSKEEILF